MASMVFDLVVFYENETETEIRADQRDCATFERQNKMGTLKALDECPLLFLRQIAFNALVRTGKLDKGISRDSWEASVLEVGFPSGEEVEVPNAGSQETPDTP